MKTFTETLDKDTLAHPGQWDSRFSDLAVKLRPMTGNEHGIVFIRRVEIADHFCSGLSALKKNMVIVLQKRLFELPGYEA